MMQGQLQGGRIRPAVPADLDRIMEIYEIAKTYMRENGNPNQWNGSYPERTLLAEDMERKCLYVYEDKGGVHAVFVLALGEEPTYRYIEGGAWLNEAPYGTIHRLASDGSVRGMFGKCVEFCLAVIPQLRADTHADNHTMQHLLQKHDFVRCGIIYLANGSPRIAYQHN